MIYFTGEAFFVGRDSKQRNIMFRLISPSVKDNSIAFCHELRYILIADVLFLWSTLLYPFIHFIDWFLGKFLVNGDWPYSFISITQLIVILMRRAITDIFTCWLVYELLITKEIV